MVQAETWICPNDTTSGAILDVVTADITCGIFRVCSQADIDSVHAPNRISAAVQWVFAIRRDCHATSACHANLTRARRICGEKGGGENLTLL